MDVFFFLFIYFLFIYLFKDKILGLEMPSFGSTYTLWLIIGIK